MKKQHIILVYLLKSKIVSGKALGIRFRNFFPFKHVTFLIVSIFNIMLSTICEYEVGHSLHSVMSQNLSGFLDKKLDMVYF